MVTKDEANTKRGQESDQRCRYDWCPGIGSRQPNGKVGEHHGQNPKEHVGKTKTGDRRRCGARRVPLVESRWRNSSRLSTVRERILLGLIPEQLRRGSMWGSVI